MRHSEFMHIIAFILSAVITISTALHLIGLFLYSDILEVKSAYFLKAFIVIFISCTILIFSCYKIYRKSKQGLYTIVISLLLSISIPVAILEFVGSTSLPPWPAIALHGVNPLIGNTEWGRIQNLYPEAIGNNSWGQRDKERILEPPKEIKRIAFIGDSFLEESSITPVSLLVETSLPSSLEIINLGISATDPIDYYWRLKNVALKLGVKHVFVFMFVGNDLLDSSPADRRDSAVSSFFAPPPQGSLLASLTPIINYHLTRKYKTSTNVWLAGNLHKNEQSHLKLLKDTSLDELPKILLRYAQTTARSECHKSLSKLDLKKFYHMITHPDMGLFRTYILTDAMSSFCSRNIYSGSAPSHETGAYSLRIIKLMSNLSQKNDVGFTVVIVPQGLDVDDRMWSQWKTLTDFRKKYQHSLKAAYFKSALSYNNIHTIDLYPAFKSKKGTYLNVDGHWSQLGNEIAAKTLVQHILKLEIN